MNVGNAKIKKKKKHPLATKKACGLKHVFSCPLEKVHITKMHCFSNWPSFIFRLCFLPFAGRSKNAEPRGPF